MSIISIKQLLEAGIHFGHVARKCHYKMKPFLFSKDGIPIVRNKINIIDLKQTITYVENAYKKMSEIAANGGKILFLGTKNKIQDIIKQEAERCQQYYIIHRWLGGTFTNFQTILKRINFLKNLYKKEAEGLWANLSKKEVMQLTKQRDKLEKFLGGIKDMTQLPQAIFIVDIQKDVIAIAEARKLNIKIFGIADSNCDPFLLDYFIPANNDAIKGVKLITSVMANAIIEGQNKIKNNTIIDPNTKKVEIKNINNMIQNKQNNKKEIRAKIE
ncbi:MAG: 30S ribosomal protein S2 [Vigna little leaf phytoplasma]|nr:30S ribosomal protein S2 [Vigna little leaf phytoplasma]